MYLSKGNTIILTFCFCVKLTEKVNEIVNEFLKLGSTGSTPGREVFTKTPEKNLEKTS